ncbi:PREDICTED: uncharacterized protein LOC109341924, partial [Lupinus angustifolius]|uniref:uncharacterized protein LOC109341924 n=1 Tax=Lupinus angustifolius TaxID=3871 RepID=UPI00092F5A7D
NEEEDVFLRLFPLTLIGKAKEWFLDQPQQILSDWNQLEEKFMARYFPQSKFLDFKTAISTFSQFVGESLCEAWERYKSMLRKCPNHGFDAKTQIHIFRNGLLQQHKLILEATSGGSLMAKTPTEAIDIIESMAINDQQDQHSRAPTRRSMIELAGNDAILAQNKLFQQQMEEMTKQLANIPKQLKEMQESSSRRHVNRCDACTPDHPTSNCEPKEEEVQYMSNQPRQGQYQNNYSRGANQNFSQPWKQDVGPSSNRPPPFQNQQYQQPPQNQQQYQQPPQNQNSQLADTLNQFMQMSMANQKNTDASIRNLETQVGQLAKQLANSHKGAFSANTEPNPKEQCKAITTRSGKMIGKGIGENLSEKNVIVVEEKIESEKEEKALVQMPTYAKFMKELLTKKRRFIEEETIELDASCSAIIQKYIPLKAKDPGSFTLPVTIGNLTLGKALLDLGASINLMPLSMLRRIGDLEARPTRMSLQLAERSMKYPHGVVEDVLVKVDKFMFPADFVVLDMEEDVEVPLILGRPFMKTARVMIDVGAGKLKVRVQDDEVNFNVFEALQYPKDKGQCFSIDVIDEVCYEVTKQPQSYDPLEKALINLHTRFNEEEEQEIERCLQDLDSLKEIPLKQ